MVHNQNIRGRIHRLQSQPQLLLKSYGKRRCA